MDVPGSGTASRKGAWSACALAVLACALVPAPADAAAAKQRKRADLVVKSLSSPPAHAVAGTTFSVTAQVRNGGTRKAPASRTSFQLSLDRKPGSGDLRLAQQAPVPALRPRAAKRRVTALTAPAVATGATYHLIACADARRRVRERSERNNCRATATRVVVAPPALPGPQPPAGPAPPAPPATPQPAGDATAPDAPVVTLSGLTHAVGSASAIHFRPVAGASFSLEAAAADPQSGIAHVSFPAAGSGWSGGGDDATAPYAAAYAFAPAGAAAPGALRVTATNGAGLVSAPATVDLVPDGEAPATTASCDGAPCGASHQDAVSVELAATDAGAGVDEIRYTIDGSDPGRESGLSYTGAIAIEATTTLRYRAYDRVGNAEGVRALAVTVGTPDPADVAPPVNPTVSTGFADAVEFLWKGDAPVQEGVEPGAIERRRVAVVRGRVLDAAGAPLEGVTVTIHDAPELGGTATRPDGRFDLAVNGGGPVTLDYAKDGFLPVQRRVDPDWRDYAAVDDVVLLPVDEAVTEVELGAADIQQARGSTVTDADGTRRATMLFPAGTQAVMELPDGTTQPLDQATVRATEYTVGDRGEEAMPGPLPAATGYTYAVELSLDEALAAGATDVRFNKPVPFYVENFIGFPVGGIVPTGYYDREQARWVPSENGRVVKVVDDGAGGEGLDVDGDGAADTGLLLEELGIDAAELERVAALYAPGQSLWRVPIRHFTPWDHNWPYGPPPGARAPDAGPPSGLNRVPDGECRRSGSIVDCQAQVLGESVPVAGTPWSLHYRSDRVDPEPSRKLRIPLTGASVPESVEMVRLQVSVGGRFFEHAFTPEPDRSYEFTWDGRDAYGRELYGRQPVTVRVGWTYGMVQYREPADFASAFSAASGSGVAVGSFMRGEDTFTSWATWQGEIGELDLTSATVGGWTLSPHHVLDTGGRSIHLGNGDRLRGGDETLLQTRFAGATDNYGVWGEGVPVEKAEIFQLQAVAAAADGSVFTAEGNVVRRIAGGVIRTFAGNRESGTAGDGGPAAQAQVGNPRGVAVGADGSVYITQGIHHRVRRVAPDGTITTLAGTGTAGAAGDDGPAAEAQLNLPIGIAAAPDGSVYVADSANARVRRIAPDGTITTFAGGGTGYAPSGGMATAVRLERPTTVAVAPDGSLVIGDATANRVYRVGTDGRLSLVAGSGAACSGSPAGPCGDGGPATQAYVDVAEALAVDRAGAVYIGDRGAYRVRRVGLDGLIRSVAGSGECCRTMEAALARQIRMLPESIAIGPEGELYVDNNGSEGIDVVRSWLDEHPDGVTSAPSADGMDVFEFDERGRHLRTRDALTGAVELQFSYAQGRLSEITDADGNVTRVERDGAGRPTAIVAPGGQRTVLRTDAGEHLSAIENPEGEVVELTSTPGGLLTDLVEPGGAEHHFAYDEEGLLVRDQGPGGRELTLTRTQSGSTTKVAVTTALGRTTTYETEQRPDGTELVRRIDPGGAVTTSETLQGGTVRTTYPSGMRVVSEAGIDPLHEAPTAFTRRTEVRTPGGKELRQRITRSLLTDMQGAPQKLLQDVTVNFSRSEETTYDFAARTLTVKSPQGRVSVATLDARGRLVRLDPAGGLDPIELVHDGKGRIQRASQGERSMTYAYDAAGRMVSRTDGAGRTVTFERDAAGRLTASILPGGRRHGFEYDPATGDLAAILMPGGQRHALGFGPGGEITSHTAPGGSPLTRAFDADGLLSQVTLPGGAAQTFARDDGGRPTGVTHADATIAYGYAAGDPSDRVQTLTRTPAGGGTAQAGSFGYDGELVTSLTTSGLADSAYTYAYDDDFEVTATTLGGGTPTAVARDEDGLLTGHGTFALTRGGPGGALSAISDGTVQVAVAYDTLGRVRTRTHTIGGAEVYRLALAYDAVDRVREKAETTADGTRTLTYAYDETGALKSVEESGAAIETYAYDANGNRTSAKRGADPAEAATYDDQDRLTARGTLPYQFDAAGFLTARGADAFDYSARGELLTAEAGDATVTYGYDALGRRVARTQGGQTTAYLYGDLDQPLRVTATRAHDGTLTTYTYDDSGLLQAIDRAGTRYYVATDHLGSPRLVLDGAGAVVKRVDYDAWGVRTDSAPGFDLAIGFAGGLHDPATGLVRFGMRDYDPASGRWTARDPALYGGNQANLYAYVDNSPVSLTDPTGLLSFGGTLCGGVCGGTKLSLTNKGLSVCFEAGFGVGSSVDLNPFGDLDSNTNSITGELSFSAGVLGTKAGFTLDECGNLKGALGASLGPVGVDQNLAFSGFSQGIEDLPGTKEGFKSGKLGVAAKVTATVCRQMLW